MQKVTHLNFSGFPGAGKTTIMAKLKEEYKTIVIPKITTRPKRPTENGGEYIFTNMEEFSQQRNEGNFIAVESNFVDGIEHFYAIPKIEFWPSIPDGTDLILSAFGIYANEVKKFVPEMKSCFVTYKNMVILLDRLYHRCLKDGSNYQEKIKVIEKYMEEHIEENYDNIIYNDGTIEETIAQIIPLI